MNNNLRIDYGLKADEPAYIVKAEHTCGAGRVICPIDDAEEYNTLNDDNTLCCDYSIISLESARSLANATHSCRQTLYLWRAAHRILELEGEAQEPTP